MLLDSNVVPDTCMTSGNNVLVYQTENVDNLINIIDLKDGVNVQYNVKPMRKYVFSVLLTITLYTDWHLKIL